MPLGRNLAPDRVQFNEPISAAALEAAAADPKVRVLQCSSPIRNATWDLVNAAFFARRPDARLRVYGGAFADCDLGFAPRMTHVRHFAADDLLQARGVEHIAALSGLQSLSLGIFSLESFDVLARADADEQTRKTEDQPEDRDHRLERAPVSGWPPSVSGPLSRACGRVGG